MLLAATHARLNAMSLPHLFAVPWNDQRINRNALFADQEWINVDRRDQIAGGFHNPLKRNERISGRRQRIFIAL